MFYLSYQFANTIFSTALEVYRVDSKKIQEAACKLRRKHKPYFLPLHLFYSNLEPSFPFSFFHVTVYISHVSKGHISFPAIPLFVLYLFMDSRE